MTGPSIESVLDCPTLPSLPRVAIEVLTLSREPEISLERIAEAIEHDQALTGRILRTVNSSFHGLSEPCPTLSRAVAYLGLNSVKSIVLGFSLVDCGKHSAGGFDYIDYWRRSVYSAAAARTLAEYSRGCDPEEAFIVSLLQDIGMIALLHSQGEAYVQVVADDAEGRHELLAEAEQAAYGFDHAAVGAALGANWGLPEGFTETIRRHHAPEEIDASLRTLARTVALANLAVRVLTEPDPAERLGEFQERARAWFQIPQTDAERLIERFAEGASELSSLLRVNTGDPPDIANILTQANTQLLEHQIALQEETRQLKEDAEALSRQAMVDPLTGAFNRKYFDEQLKARFQSVAETEGCLALAFVDVDKFKAINDSHGHQAGDAVLKEVAARLRRVVAEEGEVCRYGGEEFAVILPGAGRRAAARLAERLRLEVEASPCELIGQDAPDARLDVTVSIGVAALGPDSAGVFTTATRLFTAADKAMYAAKAGGRNCVRIFNPRAACRRAPNGTPADRSGEPEQRDTPVEARDAPSPSASASVAEPAVGTRRVLVIDDDPLASRLIVDALSQIAGVEATSLADADGALKALGDARADAPDLVLADVELGGMSGLELARALRGTEVGRSLPIILMSASAGADATRQAIEAGANAFLSKRKLSASPTEHLARILEMWVEFERQAA